MKDIFGDMQEKIGCPYLSDLPEHKRTVWFELRRMAYWEYPQEQMEDFSRYVFGIKFSVLKDVMFFLENRKPDKLCDTVS